MEMASKYRKLSQEMENNLYMNPKFFGAHLEKIGSKIKDTIQDMGTRTGVLISHSLLYIRFKTFYFPPC